MKKPCLHAKPQQKGAVLLVALVMLLLLTVIGIASMRGTSLQENMANNLKEHYLAFQAAEAALRAGERRVERERRNTTFDLPENMGCPISADVDNLGTGKKPKYTICLLGRYSGGPALGRTASDNEILMVRIDAEGYGLAVDSSNEPIVTVKMRSTFRIKLDK